MTSIQIERDEHDTRILHENALYEYHQRLRVSEHQVMNVPRIIYLESNALPRIPIVFSTTPAPSTTWPQLQKVMNALVHQNVYCISMVLSQMSPWPSRKMRRNRSNTVHDRASSSSACTSALKRASLSGCSRNSQRLPWHDCQRCDPH